MTDFERWRGYPQTEVMWATILFVALTVLSLPHANAAAGAPLPDLVAKGKYVFAAAGGGCGHHAN